MYRAVWGGGFTFYSTQGRDYIEGQISNHSLDMDIIHLYNTVSKEGEREIDDGIS